MTRLRTLVRRTLARALALAAPSQRDGLCILTYHRVNGFHPRDRLSVAPEAFEAQMELLARSGRPVVSLARALPALRGETQLPAGAVALTFDDGYADNFAVALPILERFSFSATFFLATRFIGSEATLDRYRQCCARDRMLDWEQVRLLRERGHEIGGHGREHLELGKLEEPVARAEIAACVREIERATGAPPRFFCYPRGSQSRQARRLVAEAGFEAACGVRPGHNRVGVDLMALTRTEISASDEIRDFGLKLGGSFDAWHALVQRITNLGS